MILQHMILSTRRAQIVLTETECGVVERVQHHRRDGEACRPCSSAGSPFPALLSRRQCRLEVRVQDLDLLRQ
jgi:hypothetical protein